MEQNEKLNKENELLKKSYKSGNLRKSDERTII
jgi:hypothetical protein